MFAFLLTRIVARSPISTPITRNTREQLTKFSSISRIHENRIVKDSSSAIENGTITSVTKLLKSYEFTDPQIAKFFTKFAVSPSQNLTNVMKPNLDFFLQIGFSNAQLAKFISINPRILQINLESRMKPNILLLKSFFETEKNLVRALSYTYTLAQSKLETNFFPNVTTLTNHGVPRTNIINLAVNHSRTLLKPAKKFEKLVQLVASKGFNPCSTMFCEGLHVISEVSPLKWNEKVSLYESLGWSEEAIAFAFIRHPMCMVSSEKKIRRIMDFFVNKIRCEPLYVARNPVLIKLSLEKRLIPRFLVMDILVKKRLVKKISAGHYKISNKDFLAKYVMPYQDQAPEVLHAYNGNFENACLENESLIS